MLIVFAPANMTGDRLFFAAISSAYLIVAIPWEERSLEAAYGAALRRIQAACPQPGNSLRLLNTRQSCPPC